ncbi:heparan-alpha-glucosaminide N-acetyltransferase [Brucellaceae bacterium D45D]
MAQTAPKATPLVAQTPKSPRLGRLDIARGVALIAMTIYHFGWDLEFFGYLEPATTAQGGWKLFARCIASSFLFLVGFSLVLAHGRGIRWQPMGKRLLQIVAAAAAISAITYYMSPESFIFFGILHQIALASVLGLLFLRLPPLLTLIIAALVISAPFYARADLFNEPALRFVGLSTLTFRSNDYVPLFPWFGAVLAGIAVAGFAQHYGWLNLLSGGITPRFLQKPLSFIGRHSLAFYLIHQPVLLSLVYVFSLVSPPDQRGPFTQSCVASCLPTGSEALCQQFCGCVVSELDKANLFEDVLHGKADQDNNMSVQAITQMCSPVPDMQQQ